jgi:hypothetical protein
MHRKLILAAGGATAALAIAAASTAVAAGPAVTVRVEGLHKTLLPATTVHGRRGSIRVGGTPAGACPASGGAGALDVATHHKWNGSWDPKYMALSVTSIFGETHPLTSKYYWSLWVNNGYAPTGICGIKLKAGEQLLFAAVPDTPTEYPLGLTGPASIAAGKAFTVKTIGYNSAGKGKALPGVAVTGKGVKVTSNKHGVATVTATRAGVLALHAAKAGWIRAATLHIRVK